MENFKKNIFYVIKSTSDHGSLLIGDTSSCVQECLVENHVKAIISAIDG